MPCQTQAAAYYRLVDLVYELKKTHDPDHQLPQTEKRAGEAQYALEDCMATQPVIQPVFSLGGQWSYGGKPGPVISCNGNRITVDMSAYSRPVASGIIVDTTDILVDFPDDSYYTGKLQAPGTIVWSNKSEWSKA